MSVKSKKAIEGQLYSLFLQDLPPSRAAEIVNHSHGEKVITEKTCIRFYKTFKRKGKNQQRSKFVFPIIIIIFFINLYFVLGKKGVSWL